mmetsp:Transcript_830/g.1734  ORF Transcript_830/g.1734 Transcript_830/m.1734 type:complete len:302 (-) Transcript_830:196-1101(-)
MTRNPNVVHVLSPDTRHFPRCRRRGRGYTSAAANAQVAAAATCISASTLFLLVVAAAAAAASVTEKALPEERVEVSGLHHVRSVAREHGHRPRLAQVPPPVVQRGVLLVASSVHEVVRGDPAVLPHRGPGKAHGPAQQGLHRAGRVPRVVVNHHQAEAALLPARLSCRRGRQELLKELAREANQLGGWAPVVGGAEHAHAGGVGEEAWDVVLCACLSRRYCGHGDHDHLGGNRLGAQGFNGALRVLQSRRQGGERCNHVLWGHPHSGSIPNLVAALTTTTSSGFSQGRRWLPSSPLRCRRS